MCYDLQKNVQGQCKESIFQKSLYKTNHTRKHHFTQYNVPLRPRAIGVVVPGSSVKDSGTILVVCMFLSIFFINPSALCYYYKKYTYFLANPRCALALNISVGNKIKLII